MTSGEGRVCLVLPQHPGYLLCPHTRACGWWRSGGWSCLGHLLASLARPVFFFGYSSVFCFLSLSCLLLALLSSVFFLCLFQSLLLHEFGHCQPLGSSLFCC